MKTTLVVSPGMRFRPSDAQIERQPYLKDYRYTVLKKKGAKFLVRCVDNGPTFACCEDLFYKYELESMVLIEEKTAEQRNAEMINTENLSRNLLP